MKIRVHEIELHSPLINKEDHFVLISDIHSDSNKLEEVYKIIESINPSFITIPGDVLDSISDPRNEAVKQILDYYDDRYKTFITVGNHDLVDYVKINHRTEEIVCDEMDFFNSLKKSNTTIFKDMYNGVPLDNNISVYGLNMSNEWFQNGEKTKPVAEKLSSYEFDPDKLNILLFHTSNGILDKNGELTEMNEFNGLPSLIVTGHTHGGLVPYNLQGLMPSNRGLVGPYNVILPRNAFGTYEDKGTGVIISDGVAKLHDSFGGKYIAPIGNHILIPDVYVIKMVPYKKLEHTGKRLIKTKTTIVNNR